MKNKSLFKDIFFLAVPLVLFALLFFPYSWFNSEFAVEWFGCGCPTLDINGNMIKSAFNANDFTRLFWLFVSVCAAVASALISKRIDRSRKFKIGGVAMIFIVSILISYHFSNMMLWC